MLADTCTPARRWPLRFFAVFLATQLCGCADSQPARALRIASASTSMTLCTAAFVSGVSPQRAFDMEVAPGPGMRWLAWAVRYEVDRQHRAVSSSLGGAFESRAIHRPGLGCVLAPGAIPDGSWSPVEDDWKSPDPFPELAAPEVKSAESAPLRAAIDAAFVEDRGRPRNTLAVVVLHKGHLIGERYAADVGPTTPLPGHSLSKSFVHALIGVLSRDRTIDPAVPVDVPAWRSPEDQRRAITANELLAMSSGLPWDEYRGGFDPSTRLWFDEPDPYAYAVRMPLAESPGTHWAYSNLGYTVLSRIVRDHAGGSAPRTAAWIQRELLGPLHMRHTEVTFDATGTPMGANGVVASARDWARFGLLYLHDGMIGERRQLPARWVEQARTPTLDAGYGRGFWLNNTHAPHPLPGHWGMPDAPDDAYFARGYLGQFVVVVPSKELVVVRLGISYRDGGDIATVGRLVRDCVTALAARR
ncbi:MAG TPA: serine hydrolase [Caldimonas sp.]|nr:serine hydrolase [Caldimonas sp.]